MPTEIEKKYRLSRAERDEVVIKLTSANALRVSEDFEENIIYGGGNLDETQSLLRLRRVERGATLTFKSTIDSTSDFKHRREDETPVGNADAMEAILRLLGFKIRLVYEKRRITWTWRSVEIVIDELPFGNYMEIEGEIDAIRDAEKQLGFEDLQVEHASYPALTRMLGQSLHDSTEARFEP